MDSDMARCSATPTAKEALYCHEAILSEMNRAHAIESNIDGRFFGWSGGTVFKLEARGSEGGA